MAQTTRTRTILIGLLLTGAGCATTNPDGSPLSTQQKFASCAAVATTAAVICGLASGDFDTRRALQCGALTSAGCAVWFAFNSERDRERIASLEREAARTGESQEASWVGDDGVERTVMVEAGEATAPVGEASEDQPFCRPTRTQLAAGARTGQSQTILCRTPEGDWVERDELA